jgi:hypothetical protein
VNNSKVPKKYFFYFPCDSVLNRPAARGESQ